MSLQEDEKSKEILLPGGRKDEKECPGPTLLGTTEVDNMLHAGWKKQVGDEDLHHPAGGEEGGPLHLGPKQIGAARPGPTLLGKKRMKL